MKRADVVVPVYSNRVMTERCLRAVLERSGPALHRLIIIDDRGPDPTMAPMLAALRLDDARVRLLTNEQNLGFVASCNRGMSIREGDAVLLNSDTEVTEGWLTELLEVLHTAPDLAAVSPLTNNAPFCAIPEYETQNPIAHWVWRPELFSQLPRFTELPTASGFCVALRSNALDRVGLFDPAFGRGYQEENDLAQRLRAAGYRIARANRAFVAHLGSESFGAERVHLDARNLRRLHQRHPRFLDETAAFHHGPHARLAAIAAHAEDPRPGIDVQVIRQAPRSESELVARLLAPGHLISVIDALPLETRLLEVLIESSQRVLSRSPSICRWVSERTGVECLSMQPIEPAPPRFEVRRLLYCAASATPADVQRLEEAAALFTRLRGVALTLAPVADAGVQLRGAMACLLGAGARAMPFAERVTRAGFPTIAASGAGFEELAPVLLNDWTVESLCAAMMVASERSLTPTPASQPPRVLQADFKALLQQTARSPDVASLDRRQRWTSALQRTLTSVS